MRSRSKILIPFSAAVLIGTGFLLSVLRTCEKLPPLKLEVSTDSVVIQPDRTCKLVGSIRSFGYRPVTQHGFCWATTHIPTIEDEVTQLGYKNMKGEFSSIISDLPLNAVVHVRAYALTEEGTEYGEKISFPTPGPDLPIVTTTGISNITENSARSGGTITDDGGSDITARGVCWNTAGLPTINDSITTDGTGTGNFVSTISGLTCNTIYIIRAYATNKAGTGYGDTISFSTKECPFGYITLTTITATNITSTSAESGGNITSDGGSEVTARGVCWGISPNPTISDSCTSDAPGTGTYTSSISNLSPSTLYYYRAYATNSYDTFYGNELSFTTREVSGETVTDYDGNEYQTVQIGDQVWMKENLKVTHYADGSEIPLVEGTAAWDALGTTGKAYSWYDNSTTNRDTYGGLYTWAAAMNGAAGSNNSPSGVQGVCPAGWHLPGDGEWKQLEMHIGMSQSEADASSLRGTDEGGKLKEAGFVHWTTPNTGANNESGFTALPGGERYQNGTFFGIRGAGGWWSSSDPNTDTAWSRSVFYNNEQVSRYNQNKRFGFYVRCIKDGGSLFLPSVTTYPASNIEYSTAESGGEVTSNGGVTVTACGVCWSTSESPTLDDDHTTDGGGTGTFTSSFTGLDCNTTYYLCAYATNSLGTGYGDQVSFTTSPCPALNPPTVTTSYLTNTTTNSSEGGGEVTDDGGGTIIAKGVCWSTSQNPNTSDFTTNEGTGTGVFTSYLAGLTKSTTYYVKAYATNSAGTSYGDEVILRTYEGTVTDYDGNTYWTVIIGSQKWMAGNLKTTRYADGAEIELVEAAAEWDALIYSDKAYCWYDNYTSNGDDYGGLYNWAALMNGANSNEDNPSGIQGVCPDGWHIPSNPEWTQLSDYLGGYSIAGGKLKEPGAAHWIDPNTAATNESGFTALPGGLRSPDGSFSQMGEYGWWWACSEYKGDGVLRRLQYDDAEIYSGWTTNLPGYSVRCVEGQGYNVPAVTTTSVTNMTINSAEAGGIVTDDGGQPVTERGICWSTGTDPTIYNDKTSDGGGSGSFSGSLTGLSEFTVYYIRAYATNSVGTGYGEELSFRTSTVTDYDGNVYRIVQIGDQLWMAENLRAFHYADGTPIPLVESTAAWDNMEGSDKAYCWYENSIAYRNAFGGLYTWAAAMNGAGSSNTNPSGVQGVCPTGWHLPSDEEWKQLEIYIEMSQAEADSEGWRGTDQGGRLKESGYAHWQFPNTGASDQYGFTALPGGYRQTNGTFSSIGNYGFWHSSALYGGIFVWYRTLDYNDPRIGRYSGDTKTGNSIRCLKD